MNLTDVDLHQLDRTLQILEILNALMAEAEELGAECEILNYLEDVEDRRLARLRQQQRVIYSTTVWLDMMDGTGEFAELAFPRQPNAHAEKKN